MKQLNKTAYNFSVSLILIRFFMILNFLNKKESKVICKREFEIILQTQSLSSIHRQPNVMVACAQAHVAQAMDCIVVLYPKVGKCNQTNDTYTFKQSKILQILLTTTLK